MRPVAPYMQVVLALAVAVAVLGYVAATSLIALDSVSEYREVWFGGMISANVTNYSSIVTFHNLTVRGAPQGAVVEFEWMWQWSGLNTWIEAYYGASPNGVDAVVCEGGNQLFGSCGWSIQGPFTASSFSIGIWTVSNSPHDPPPFNQSSFVDWVGIQGTYTYSASR